MIPANPFVGDAGSPDETSSSAISLSAASSLASSQTSFTPASNNLSNLSSDYHEVVTASVGAGFNISGYKINYFDNTGLPGWNITIANDTMQTSTLTDSNGFYEFTNFINGTYTVFEEQRSDWTNVSPVFRDITISGKDEMYVNFTNNPMRIVSDDFSAPTLNTSLWTKIDPQNDATFTIAGTGTSDALLSISIPAGTSHDVWGGNNLAPRIMQSVSNTDFEIEVKFESQLSSQYQMQGVIIQQNDSNFLRFDIFTDGTNIRVFAASFSGGISTKKSDVTIIPGNPLYLRIKRLGDQWAQFYSYDGTHWTTAANFSHPLTVTSIGPFIGNAGSSPPAFTGLIDYFFNAASPIIPEDPDDTAPPSIIDYTPTGTDVPVSAQINVTFNKSMDQTSVESAFSTSPATSGSFTWNGSIMTYIPDSDLTGNTTYSVTIGTSAMDLANNPLQTEHTWQFTTGFTIKTGFTIISDDFNAPALDTSIWTIIDPIGDAKFTIVGNGTPNALLSITIPAGTSHDVWVGGNYAPRIMQTANNSDFEIELKFQSEMTSKYQTMGLIVEQDINNYLRFDFVRNSLTTRAFAASFAGGSPTVRYNIDITPGNPLYMRINRTGNQWRQFYSHDGTDWISAANFNHTITVTSIGPFIGNAGSSPPAFTGQIDYFFNTSSPILPEDEFDTTPPNITLWYGNSQSFGHIGVPQQWVNILGNVQDESAVASITYSLNNGSVQDLSIGPVARRLQSVGDFNIEVNHTDLVCGDNQVVINSTDTYGNTQRETVSVNYSCNTIWPVNYTIDWSNEANIYDVAQIVDGLWIKETNSIRPVIIGYDRLIAVGDMTWDDYEITVPVTINEQLDSSLPWGPNFGVIMRWQGHYDRTEEPRDGWWPLGALGVYIWVPHLNDYRLRIIGNNMAVIADDTSGKHLEVGIPYMFKMRALTNGTITRYSLKVWEQNMSEPAEWTISGNSVSGELKHGSAMLISHYSNVSFGNVNIKAPPFGDPMFPMPPIITMQPMNQTSINGSVATFSVAARGSTPLNYQWKINGVNITNATGPSYTTHATTLSDGGTKFSVIVSNVHGSLTSNEATLFVIEAPPIPWWNTSRPFRVPVTVNAARFERYEKPVDVSLNFTHLLSILEQTGTFDESSLRVIETDSLGVELLNPAVPFQFDKDTGFNADTKASGTIVFIMEGTTPANMNRYYHIYFGLTGGSYIPLPVAPQVAFTDNVMDEGQLSYQIGTAGSTYYFQKQAGGFSSLLDSSGNDWISYNTNSGSAGTYRGIPNVYTGGIFHPGGTSCTSSIISKGPLKIRLRSVCTDGKWESLWDFYPGYATMTMVKAGGKYWWLYDGTPGGILEPDKDFIVRPDNSKTLLSQSWDNDLTTQEWAYFSDPTAGRSFFVSHHEDDTITDSYRQMDGKMTVFGFGRTASSKTGLLTSASQKFTMGLMDGTEFSQSAKTVYSAYKDLSITKGTIEQYDSATLPIIVTQPADSTVRTGASATFSV
ncbi:MAG: DUF1349 domain-containing protein, partial [ANME-2 cluster archaeon]|nr:DUF1349 domain-containing protein [ANME-2 cluster archaeon]